MTAKLSPDSIGLIFTMNAAGHCAEEIADAAGCSYSTVVRYLNQAWIVLGNKGRPKEFTAEYLTLALNMRASGARWVDVERKIGFGLTTIKETMRAQSCS